MRNLLNLGVLAALRQAHVDTEGAEGTEVQVEVRDIADLAMDAEKPETDEDVQARHARLQAAEAQAQQQANDGTQVPDRVLQVAKAEIVICWEEFAGQDGVYDLQKRAQKKLGNIAQHILTIARECAAAAWERCEGDPRLDFGKLAASMFRNSIAMAELYLRGTLDLAKPDMEDRLDKFLGSSWKVYTSQVRSATEAGFDPRDHESIYSLRKAVEAAKAATSTGTREDGQQGGESGGGNADAQANGEQTSEEAARVTEAITTAAEQIQRAEGAEREGLDWSELSAIAQGSAKIQGALVLLHQAIHGTKLDEGNAEERVTNILNVAIREVNKLARRPELADDGSDGEAADSDDAGETVAELGEMEPELEAHEA